MRQRSASSQDDAMEYQSDPFARRPSAGSTRPRTPKVAPRLSLPQRPESIDSTLAEEFPDEMPQPERQPKRARKPSTQSLVVHSAATSPLDLREPASPADLQIIPRTSPAVPSVKIKQSWFHSSSPRFTFIKLSLIALIVCGVLTATFATAGGNANLLFHALSNVLPFSAPAAQQQSGPTTVAQRVQPIIQADLNAGYDSKAQHDLWWDSACSAAAMTEVLHAWGITNVTIGQLIDVMSAHNPPYITSWGGLMSQDAWEYMMSTFNMRATVQMNHGMSYDDILNMTEVQGIPVVLGVRDSGEIYYPALSVGHFLVAVGGDEAGIRIVDSSLYRITYLPKNELNYLWTGETIVIKPA
ncbi:MAG TPA: hypothetical protein VKT82_32515 [Ktedonobacterales bacterium]|nr:hypothetical protein [Ktedonobacterales bacterium]